MASGCLAGIYFGAAGVVFNCPGYVERHPRIAKAKLKER